MTALDIVRAAIPTADEALADLILWGRTIFPIAPVSVRELFQAAARFRRAGEHCIRLCDWCDRKAEGGKYLCRNCEKALRRARDERSNDAS